jgi:hypothetical protein
MNTRLGFIRLTALAATCALGFGIASSAQAGGYRGGYHGGWNGHGHSHSHFSLSINLADVFFRGDNYYAPRHRSRDRYYDNYGYDNYGYDNYGYSNYNNYGGDYGYYNQYPQFNIGYSYNDRGYDRRRGREHWDGDRDGRDHWNGNRGGWGGDVDNGAWNGDHGGWRGNHDGHEISDYDAARGFHDRSHDDRHRRHW